jgi:hypothetical protein
MLCMHMAMAVMRVAVNIVDVFVQDGPPSCQVRRRKDRSAFPPWERRGPGYANVVSD